MAKNIISLVLLLLSAGLSFKHARDLLLYKSNPASAKMMADLGIGEPAIPFLGFLTVLTGVLLLIPKTFFAGNVLNALLIVLIMALALRTGNIRMALMEIPFLAIPLIMIWLKYPFKN
jgi:hypothetical protein